MIDLFARLSNIQKLEKELVKRAASIIQADTPMYYVDLFILGAVNRTLAQSRGFRTLIETKNFPSAAILLRTQIDTAMRVNGLLFLDTPEAQLHEMFKGNKTFRSLVSSQKTTKGKDILMKDVFLRKKLEEDEPWIGKVYEKTSDFVHLSFRPLVSSIQSLDDEYGTVELSISGEDNTKDESEYYEICDAFSHVSKLVCTSVLDVLTALHTPDK